MFSRSHPRKLRIQGSLAWHAQFLSRLPQEFHDARELQDLRGKAYIGFESLRVPSRLMLIESAYRGRLWI